MGNQVSASAKEQFKDVVIKMKLADLRLIFKGSTRRANGEPFTEAELSRARAAVAGLKAYTYGCVVSLFACPCLSLISGFLDFSVCQSRLSLCLRLSLCMSVSLSLVLSLRL